MHVMGIIVTNSMCMFHFLFFWHNSIFHWKTQPLSLHPTIYQRIKPNSLPIFFFFFLIHFTQKTNAFKNHVLIKTLEDTQTWSDKCLLVDQNHCQERDRSRSPPEVSCSRTCLEPDPSPVFTHTASHEPSELDQAEDKEHVTQTDLGFVDGALR